MHTCAYRPVMRSWPWRPLQTSGSSSSAASSLRRLAIAWTQRQQGCPHNVAQQLPRERRFATALRRASEPAGACGGGGGGWLSIAPRVRRDAPGAFRSRAKIAVGTRGPRAHHGHGVTQGAAREPAGVRYFFSSSTQAKNGAGAMVRVQTALAPRGAGCLRATASRGYHGLAGGRVHVAPAGRGVPANEAARRGPPEHAGRPQRGA